MTKPKYKLGSKIYKYDYDSNSIEELMISGITVMEYCDNTLNKGINKEDTYYVINYRFASKQFVNLFNDIREHEINQKYYFDSIEKLQQHLLGCYNNQNKLS